MTVAFDKFCNGLGNMRGSTEFNQIAVRGRLLNNSPLTNISEVGDDSFSIEAVLFWITLHVVEDNGS